MHILFLLIIIDRFAVSRPFGRGASRRVPWFSFALRPRSLVSFVPGLLNPLRFCAECFRPLAEERGPVHIVATDTIAAISVQRASVATTVSVAEQSDTAKAACNVWIH